MRLLIFLFCLSLTVPAQNKIIKVIDSNLFELDNHQLVRLAGIESPSVLHPDSRLRDIGIDIQKYVQDYLKGPVIIESASDNTDSIYQEVFMFRKYPFYTEFYNKHFLVKGYGRFKKTSDSGYDSILQNAETEAIVSKSGIWKYLIKSSRTALDTMVSDSAAVEYLVREKGFFVIPEEIILGGASGIIGGLVNAFMAIGISGREGWDALGIGILSFYPGYVLASAGTVYSIGHYYNPEVSFGSTFLCSLAGFAAAAGLVYAQENSAFDNTFFYTSLALPLAGSVLYVNLEDPPEKKFSGNHQDIINLHTVSFELLRIRL